MASITSAALTPHVGAVSLAAVLALAACGGSEAPDATPEAPQVDSDADLAALVPDEIREAGELVIGVEADYPPGEYLDTDGQTVQGFNVDLVDAVAAKLDLETSWEPTTFDSIIIGVDSGTYDIGSSSFTITAERMEAVNMVSYFSSGTQWFAQAGNPENVDPDRPCGLRVAVQSGTTHDDDIEARNDACVEAGEDPITIEKFPGQPQATETVVSGKNDASLADMPTAAYALEQTGEQLEFVGDQYDAAPYGIVVHQDDDALAEAIAAGFEAIIEDGTYDQILQNWGISGGALASAEVNPDVED